MTEEEDEEEFPPGDKREKGRVFVWYDERIEKKRIPLLADFSRYRGNLATLLHELEEWKPYTFLQLFKRGYKDRFTWYTAIFGIIIALLGITSIVTSIISTNLAYRSLHATFKGLALQMAACNGTVS